jgi:hypothetical protein
LPSAADTFLHRADWRRTRYLRGTWVARLSNDGPRVQDQIDDLEVRVRRQALVIQRLATEFHALLVVLGEKRVASLAEVHAAERRLDLAAEVARAKEIVDIARDLSSLDAELDQDEEHGRGE